ncbi:MAG: hydrogenase expression/formation protein HypE [Syntrophomonadaceae bacterium]|jgi:hydrogenase expression/formation protein HypE|nr:hydrogenase expression/formation protein HypE [Bacillota bacterium]NLP25502.1 hydrogenase expression/formation protein HypE [Syntrophomonadaceae bacterium]
MKHSHILLAHGSGGRLSQQLIEEMFVSSFDKHAVPRELNDGAVLALPPGKVVMSTDSFVISPLFFPGGDIGKLAVSGTVNDLVACGSRPLYLSTAFILEEGFSLDSLRRIVQSMADTARLAGVELVTGDTKVVEKGSVDQIFINTAGIGVVPDGVVYQPGRINAGDRVLVTGTIGDHGLTILAEREGFKFNTPVTSDCAPLHEIGQSLQPFGEKVHCMRDPTRGGLATVLNELAVQAGLGIQVEEERIPILDAVRSACNMLGMDPLYMANEGKMVIICEPGISEKVLSTLRSIDVSKNATDIGEVISQPAGMVLIKTALGIERILTALEGEHVPRIC